MVCFFDLPFALPFALAFPFCFAEGMCARRLASVGGESEAAVSSTSAAKGGRRGEDRIGRGSSDISAAESVSEMLLWMDCVSADAAAADAAAAELLPPPARIDAATTSRVGAQRCNDPINVARSIAADGSAAAAAPLAGAAASADDDAAAGASAADSAVAVAAVVAAAAAPVFFCWRMCCCRCCSRAVVRVRDRLD